MKNQIALGIFGEIKQWAEIHKYSTTLEINNKDIYGDNNSLDYSIFLSGNLGTIIFNLYTNEIFYQYNFFNKITSEAEFKAAEHNFKALVNDYNEFVNFINKYINYINTNKKGEINNE